jgi:putative Mn2+ efflux pump MntP
MKKLVKEIVESIIVVGIMLGIIAICGKIIGVVLANRMVAKATLLIGGVVTIGLLVKAIE